MSHVYGNGTNSTTGANTTLHKYDRAGIKAATAELIYAQFADSKSMPQKYGKTYKISMFEQILDGNGVAGTGLDKDGNPTAGNLYGTNRDVGTVTTGLPVLGEGASDVNKVTVTKKTGEVSFNRFGLHITYTDEVDLFGEDNNQIQYREMLGDAAKQVNEDLVQKDLLSGSNVYYSGAATSRATVGALTTVADGSDDADSLLGYDDVRKVIATMVMNRAKKYTSIVEGSTKVDTKTINPSYIGVIGPEIKYDLQGIADMHSRPAWIPANQYASAATLMNMEVGSVAEMRFVESERAMKWRGGGAAIPVSYVGSLANDGANFDVFPVLCPTKGSFATVGLSGWGKMKFKAKAPGAASDTDKYGNRGFFSVNWFYAGIILDQSKLMRIETCATDLGFDTYDRASTNGPATMA